MVSSTGGVLWDLDGTLIDSAGFHWIAWRDTLAGEGREVSERDFANTFGKRNDEILRELFGKDITPQWIRRVSDAKELAYRRQLRTHGLAALPGALDWLRRLHEAGWKQAIASSAPRPNIDAVLDVVDMGRYLQTVVSADEVGRGKPDPALFLECARLIGVLPPHCIVVEDAPAGVEGARRAGMRSIGVLSHHHRRLSDSLVVPSLEELPPDAFMLLLSS
jgi:beta-phosphoglucomutase